MTRARTQQLDLWSTVVDVSPATAANDAPPAAVRVAPAPTPVVPVEDAALGLGPPVVYTSALECLCLLGPSSVATVAECLSCDLATAERALAGLATAGHAEQKGDRWRFTMAGYEAMCAVRGLTPAVAEDRAADPEPPRPAPPPPAAMRRPRRGIPCRPAPSMTVDELPPPDVIAGQIVDGLRDALDTLSGLEQELGTTGTEKPTAPSWSVFVTALVMPGYKVVTTPVLVEASNRYAAESIVGRAFRCPASVCFALPVGVVDAAAIPLDVHPDRPPPMPFDLGAEVERVLGDANARAEQETADLHELHASILGCSADEAKAKLDERRAEEHREKAARKVEARAYRQPAPKNAAKPATGSAPLDKGMRSLTARQRELLGLVEVDPKTNRVVYTREGHLPDWAALKQVVEALGGVYRTAGKKTKGGWIFPDDVDAMAMVANAIETGGVLDPTLLGYYPTTDVLSDTLVARLNIQPGERVLEPSGGDGAMARAVLRACPTARIECVEVLPDNRAKLTAQGFRLIGEDFLAMRPEDVGPFDVVCANPPFGKGRVEIHHVRHMLGFLRPGGRMGVILPPSVRERDDALTTSLRADLDACGVTWIDNGAGAFREAGTMIRTVCGWLTKPM